MIILFGMVVIWTIIMISEKKNKSKKDMFYIHDINAIFHQYLLLFS